MGFGALAVLAHAISAFGVIRGPEGYQFGLMEISSLIAVSISVLVLISSLRKPLQNLFLGLFPPRNNGDLHELLGPEIKPQSVAYVYKGLKSFFKLCGNRYNPRSISTSPIQDHPELFRV